MFTNTESTQVQYRSSYIYKYSAEQDCFSKKTNTEQDKQTRLLLYDEVW